MLPQVKERQTVLKGNTFAFLKQVLFKTRENTMKTKKIVPAARADKCDKLKAEERYSLYLQYCEAI
jgi:hypothetical protein